MVKKKLNKLLEVGFIRLVETTEWVSPMVLALKKNGKGMHQLQSFEQSNEERSLPSAIL
jgi:hypothetical protein